MPLKSSTLNYMTKTRNTEVNRRGKQKTNVLIDVKTVNRCILESGLCYHDIADMVGYSYGYLISCLHMGDMPIEMVQSLSDYFEIPIEALLK